MFLRKISFDSYTWYLYLWYLCVTSGHAWFKPSKTIIPDRQNSDHGMIWKTCFLEKWWQCCLDPLRSMRVLLFFWSGDRSIKNGNCRSHHFHGVVDVVDHCGILGEVVIIQRKNCFQITFLRVILTMANIYIYIFRYRYRFRYRYILT